MTTTQRAIEYARAWYPLGEVQVAEVTDAEVTVVIAHEGSTYVVHFVDLDAEAELVTDPAV